MKELIYKSRKGKRKKKKKKTEKGYLLFAYLGFFGEKRWQLSTKPKKKYYKKNYKMLDHVVEALM